MRQFLAMVFVATGVSTASAQSPAVVPPVTNPSPASTILTAVDALTGLAQDAYQLAESRAAAVDPADADAVADAALDLAVAEQTFIFLDDAVAAVASLSNVAANADPQGDAVAAQVGLDYANYFVTMASNNLWLLGDDSDTSDPAPAAAMADAPRTPETVEGPDGKSYPAVPKGATGTPTDNNKGLTYPIPAGTKGLDPRVKSIRVMEPTKLHPNGYVVYMNDAKPTAQTVNPTDGKTTKGNSDPWSHIDLPPK